MNIKLQKNSQYKSMRNAKDDESRRKIIELKCKFLMDSKKQIEKNWENK